MMCKSIECFLNKTSRKCLMNFDENLKKSIYIYQIDFEKKGFRSIPNPTFYVLFI